MGPLKSLLRAGAYRSGALPLLHRRWNRNTLTVVSFHRVLPPAHPEMATAMEAFTVSTVLFEAIVRFVDRNYRIVSMPEVVAALAGEGRLPERAATFTFDDGWADNEEHAAPVLRRLRLPATLFLATGVLDGEDIFWREHLHVIHRSLPRDRFDAVWRNHAGRTLAGAERDEIGRYRIIFEAEALEAGARRSLMAELREASGVGATTSLMSVEHLRSWASTFDVGGHGHTHDPLTRVDDLKGELARVRAALRRLSPGAPSDAPWTFSAPHGAYDERVVDAVRAAGFAALFTSDACVNRLDEGRPRSDVLGRVFGSTRHTTEGGRFSPTRTGNFFFRAPRVRLTGSGPGGSSEGAVR